MSGSVDIVQLSGETQLSFALRWKEDIIRVGLAVLQEEEYWRKACKTIFVRRLLAHAPFDDLLRRVLLRMRGSGLMEGRKSLSVWIIILFFWWYAVKTDRIIVTGNGPVVLREATFINGKIDAGEFLLWFSNRLLLLIGNTSLVGLSWRSDDMLATRDDSERNSRGTPQMHDPFGPVGINALECLAGGVPDVKKLNIEHVGYCYNPEYHTIELRDEWFFMHGDEDMLPVSWLLEKIEESCAQPGPIRESEGLCYIAPVQGGIGGIDINHTAVQSRYVGYKSYALPPLRLSFGPALFRFCDGVVSFAKLLRLRCRLYASSFVDMDDSGEVWVGLCERDRPGGRENLCPVTRRKLEVVLACY